MVIIEYELVEVGLFKMPGILIKNPTDNETLDTIEQWCNNSEGVGKRATHNLWQFKQPAHRDWFILRWSGN